MYSTFLVIQLCKALFQLLFVRGTMDHMTLLWGKQSEW